MATSRMPPTAPALRLDAPLILGACALAIFTLTRLALALIAGPAAVPLAAWPAVFAKGLWFDLVVIVVLIAPLWLYDALLPDRWRASRVQRIVRWIGFLVVVAALLFVAVAEVTFWMEFATRFNFIALDYLVYTREVIGNIRESYPVGRILAGLFAAALAVAFALRSPLDRADRRPASWKRRGAWLAAALVLPPAALSVASVEQMAGSGNAYADELAGNGMFTFVAAARRNELDYDRFYATIDQDRADRLLKSLGVERKPLIAGSVPPAQAHEDDEEHLPMMPAMPRHVVMVTIESMSAQFMGAYGSHAGPHAQPRPHGRGRAALRELLRHRHAHRARAGGRLARDAARPGAVDRAPARATRTSRPSASCWSTRASRPASCTAATATSTT